MRTIKLDASAQEFLDHLRLPMTHPLHSDDSRRELYNGISIDLLTRVETGGVFELPIEKTNGVKFISNTSDPDADTNIIHRYGHNAITQTQLNSQSLQELHHKLLHQQPASPIIGPISLLELHDHSIHELLVTVTTMLAPTLAMMELWLRFFAVFLCPLCLCYMIQWEIKLAITNAKPSTDDTVVARKEKDTTTVSSMVMAIYIVGLASSAVLLTDSLYVYEYGRWFGFALFVMSSVMAVRCATTTTATLMKRNHEMMNYEDENNELKCIEMGRKVRNVATRRKIFLFRCVIALLIVSTILVFLRSDGGYAMENAINRFAPRLFTPTRINSERVLIDPGIDLPTMSEGLYHSSYNTLITSIISHWPESSRTYNVANDATSYLVNGDQRTGIPFLVNKVEEQEYVRVWTQNEFDGEYLALDIAFPYSDYAKEAHINDENGYDTYQQFVHDHSKPVYLVLHGLNGGSHEEYVKDLVLRRRSEGSTVIVLIARGMMDTKLAGWNVFHGARTGDIDAAARAIRSGLISLAETHQIKSNQRQILAGVGYSMGEPGNVDFSYLTDHSPTHLVHSFLLHRCHHSIQLCCSFRRTLRSRRSHGYKWWIGYASTTQF